MILGTIQTVTNNEGATILIDGETAPTTKKYAWLAPYYPHVGDRVLIEEVSGSYVILGSITSDPRTEHVYALSNNLLQHPDPGYVSFGVRGGDLYFGVVPLDGGPYTLYKLQKA